MRDLWDDRDLVERAILVLSVVAVTVGIVARFAVLGSAPLSIDEYYLTVSAESVFESWLPRYDLGGYYARGLLQQYFSVPLAALFGDSGLALRVVSAISNLAILPALFLLARRLVSQSAAFLLLILFSLSLWEIEFSRFARMYAMFQAFYFWAIYCLVRYSESGDEKWRHWVLALSAISIVVYEGAIFLVALNFLALLIRGERPRLSAMILPILILFAAYLYYVIDFRHLGVGPHLPLDYANPGAAGLDVTQAADAAAAEPSGRSRTWRFPIGQPPLLLPFLSGIWFAGYGLLLAAGAGLGALLYREEAGLGGPPLRSSWLLLISGLGALNLYGLAIMGTAVLFLLGWQGRDWRESRYLVPIVALNAAFFLFWLAFLVIDREWLTAIWAGEYGFGKGLVWTLFGYPDYYSKFFIRWLQAMPIVSILISLIIAGGLGLVLLKDRAPKPVTFLAAVVILMITAVCIINQQYRSIRYSFFLYPVILLMVVMCLDRLSKQFFVSDRSRGIACMIAVGALLVLGEDFGVRHLLRLNQPEIQYRLAYDRWREDQYYRRWDYESPAQYVNERAGPDDIIITSSHAVPYYLDRLDYFYTHESSEEFVGVSAASGSKELWSGAGLLYRANMLMDTVEAANQTVWLIFRADSFGGAREEERVFARYDGSSLDFTSVDGNLVVFRVTNRT